MSRSLRLASLGAATLLAAAAIGLTAAGPASAAVAWPAHYSAPYVDTGLSNTTLTSVAGSYGDKFFTLAFVDGAGCQWSMYNTSGWQTQIANLRAAGGDVSISFGGWTSDNGGTDLGSTCSTAAAAATQMENVVTTFNVTHLDFDIEAAALSNHADVDRTNQALALVRSWASGSGRALSISYTIPVLPSGLTSDGQYVLSSGRSAGFTPDVVNVMAMDYGTSGTEMGTAANQAMDASASQVASAYGKPLAGGYGMLGVTPMIGQNDSAGEIFTLADAATVESHAAAQGITELAFWSEGRDNGGCPGQTTASSTCSGLSQNTGDFTVAFNKFTGGTAGGGGGGGGGNGTAVGPIVSGVSSGLCVDDQAASTANYNPVQIYTCNGTNAQQWTVVYASNTLRVLGKCLDVYAAGTTDGTKADLYDCNGTGAQVFVPQANGSLLNPQSGKCLDDPNSSTTAGTQLQIWDCNGTAAQHWALPQATGPIVSGVSSSLCVDDTSSSTANFNPVQIWSCNGTGAQQWTVVENGNTLRVLGKCMDVNSGGTVNGTKVDLYDCNGTGAQVFVPQANGALLNPKSNKCLDDPNGSTASGTQLQIWDCNAGTNQHWNLP